MRRPSSSWRAVSRLSTSLASAVTASSPRSSSPAGMGPRWANSAARSRTSAAPPRPATTHWRRLPHRCRTRLPMLLREGCGRHHTCTSSSWPRQCLILPRALVSSFAASAPTAAARSSAVSMKKLLFGRFGAKAACRKRRTARLRRLRLGGLMSGVIDSTLHADRGPDEGGSAPAMKILFLHGWQSVPGGVKPTFLASRGHEVVNPKLPDEDFNEAVRIAQAEFDRHRPDVVVGSSRGGAVAMSLGRGEAKLVLLCPAWKRHGTARTVKPGTVILHSRADDVVPFADSEALLRNSGLPASALIEVGTDHRLADPGPLAAMVEAWENLRR